MDKKDEFKVSDKRASHDEGKVSEAPPAKADPSPKAPEPAPPSRETIPAGGSADGGHGLPQPSDHPHGELPAHGSDEEPPLTLLELNFQEISNFFLGILLQKAWLALGLVGNPDTGRIERNIPEARQFIDLVSAIADHMKGKWGEPMLETELQTQLTNLRLNYAKLADPK